MLKYTQVVFDVDGTLVDSRMSALGSLQQVVEEYTGSRPSIEDLYFSTGIPGENALRQLGITDPSALVRWRELAGKLAYTITVFPGIVETLERLQDLGCALGIVSSRERGEYADEITPLGLDPYFPVRILVEDTTKHKPEPEPMLEYLRRTAAAAEETLYVGDTVYDMKCALSAGVDFALASWGAAQPVEDAPYVLQEPEDLVALVRGA